MIKTEASNFSCHQQISVK